MRVSGVAGADPFAFLGCEAHARPPYWLQVVVQRLQMLRRSKSLKTKNNFGFIATSGGLVCNLLAGVAVGRRWAEVVTRRPGHSSLVDRLLGHQFPQQNLNLAARQ